MARDGVGLVQQVAKLIRAIQQTESRKGLYRESHRDAGWQAERIRFQIDGDLTAGIRQQPLVRSLFNDDRQQTVLEGIAAKNIGDFRADDGPETKVQQRPGRMFAR
jgi:hypothetical protein